MALPFQATDGTDDLQNDLRKKAATDLGARTLLGAPGLTTRSKTLLGAKGIATRSKQGPYYS